MTRWKKGTAMVLASVLLASPIGTDHLCMAQAALFEEGIAGTSNATGVPGKPQLQHDQYVGDTDGDYTITVSMWYGNNGTSYKLYEKRGKQGTYEQVMSGTLTDDSPNPQQFSIDITGKNLPGTYYYYVELINSFGSTTSDEISVSVGSTTTAKLILDKIDADEIVNQYVMKQGTDTFRIDYPDATNPQYTVISSNPSVVKAEIVGGDTLQLEAVAGGRTGIRLEEKESGEVRCFGVRVKEADGSLTDQTSYLAIGQVSEDSKADLDFWKSTAFDDTNKRMDIRYIYINGGPISGWRSWSGEEPEKRVKSYITESLKLGMVPYFVYYNIPDGSESYDVDYQHINDKEYMKAYYEDLVFFLETCDKYDAGEQVGIILEPDFLGYMMQQASAAPDSLPAAGVESVYTSGILEKGVDPDFPNTLEGLVKSINYIISIKYPSAIFGWQFNTWGYSNAPSQGLMHATETMGLEEGREFIRQAAIATAQYYRSAGILEYGADFISIDKYGLDGAYQGNASMDPAGSSWLWNSDLWNNYLYYTKTLHETTEFPVTLWQIPVGHLNHSLEPDPYDGGLFADLDNTEQHYEDSAPTFFFGDTFEPGTDARMEYFSKNAYHDPKVHVSGSTITYDSHMEEAKDAGITCILFGAGVGSSTDAVGDPPTDDYWWITKAQRYYRNPVLLNEVTMNLNAQEGILKEGERLTLTATVSPGDTVVIWTSQNPDIATVEDGIVTAVTEGITVIYAKAGNVTKEYLLTVEKRADQEEVGLDTEHEIGDQSGSGSEAEASNGATTEESDESGSDTTDKIEVSGSDSQGNNEQSGDNSGNEASGNDSENEASSGYTTEENETSGEDTVDKIEGDGSDTADKSEVSGSDSQGNNEQSVDNSGNEASGSDTAEKSEVSGSDSQGRSEQSGRSGGNEASDGNGGNGGDTTKKNEASGNDTADRNEHSVDIGGSDHTGSNAGGDDAGKQPETNQNTQNVVQIEYELNGGKNDSKNQDRYVTGETIVLYPPARKGYRFVGWYTDRAYQVKAETAIPQQVLTNNLGSTVQLYAKWAKVKSVKTSIKKLQSKKKGRLIVQVKKKNNVDGYRILVAKDKHFKKGKKTVSGYKTKYTLKLKSGQTYYVKVCTYQLDSTGEKVYSKYTKGKKYKVK